MMYAAQGSGTPPPLEQFLELVPLLVSPTHSVISVVKLLAQRGSPFRYALVGDPQKLVGIFTATDALQWLAQERMGKGITLGQVMSTPVITFAARDYRDPLALLNFMRERGIEHLPIVDEQGSLLGVVDREDLYAHLYGKLILDPYPPQSTAPTEAQQALVALFQLEEEILTEELQKALNLRIGIEHSIPLGIAAADLQGKQIYVNDTFAEMVGWPKEELVGRDPPYVYWPPEELENIFAAFAQGLDQGRPLQGWELTFMRRNGERFPVRILDSPWRDGEGNLIGMIASVQDLTPEQESQIQKQRLEQSLKQQEDLFQKLFDLSVNGIAITNSAGQIVKVNDNFCQLTGYSRSELLGKHYEEITHPEDLPQEKIYIEEIQSGQRQGYRMEKRYLRKNGESVWVDLSSFIVDIPDEDIYGIASVTDISQQKQAQEQLQRQLQQTQLLSRITQGIRQFLQVEDILNFTVREVRHWLQVDRVVIYRFLPNWAGEIATESISQSELSLLGRVIEDFCFMSQWHQSYQRGRVSVIENIDSAPIQACHRELLASLQVRANLVVPILQAAPSCPYSADSRSDTEPGHLWGLLIAHHCTAPKSWDPWMLESLKQSADQLGLALQQAVLFQQLQATNAELQYQVEVHNGELHQLVSYEQLLRLISDKVRSSLSEEEILTTVTLELTQSLNLGVCGVVLLEAETQTYTLAYEYAGSMPGIGRVTLPIDPVWLKQLHQGQTLFFTFDHPLRGWCTVVACPLFTGIQDRIPSETSSQTQSKTTTSLLGFLKLLRPPQEAFTPAEIRFAEQIATQCSIAIRQARLYQETQNQLQQLMELNQLKEDFLNMVSHELRTPLTSMKMAIKMLEVSGVSEKQSRYFNILKKEWQKELDLVNDLLDLQRLESGSCSLEPTPFVLQQWLQELLEPFALRFQERQLTFISQIPPDPITFTTDVGLLTRILSELLNNAVKYTPTGEQVHLWVSDCLDPLRLRVTNTGVQIPSEHLPRIFEKFYRVPQPNQAQQRGTGLGLPLVKKAVELLQGNLQVESQENRTVFEVSLPNLSTESPLYPSSTNPLSTDPPTDRPAGSAPDTPPDTPQE